ncbi:MAG TPA: hypothetical protein VM012_03875, partial [Flavitalea sp.]|nr:hypothetical protein [Flavitalea sp.]
MFKVKLFFSCIGCLFIVMNSYAKIWRLNNNAGVAADFTTLQSAHNSASVGNGDTLHLEGSPTSYGSLTC